MQPAISEGRLVRQALGADWEKLPETVRARFAQDPAEVTHYTGIMTEVACSRLGWLMAQMGRLVRAPLIPHQGHNIRIAVHVFAPGDGSVMKERTYFFPGKKPLRVTSAMRIGAAGYFQECVHGGIGMNMRIFAENDALHFVSDHYFCTLFGRQRRIPHLLTPGTTHVVHSDAEDGQFRVHLEMHHPLFGRTFLQSGLFRETDGRR